MDLVGRDHHPAASDFIADQLGLEVFSAGDEFHFRRDPAGSGKLDLCHRKTWKSVEPPSAKDAKAMRMEVGLQNAFRGFLGAVERR
jgi:hypothetical protein